MKLALTLSLLAVLSVTCLGQSTYTYDVQPNAVHVTGGHGALTAFNLVLTDPATGQDAGGISWVTSYNPCPGSTSPTRGFSFLFLNGGNYQCLPSAGPYVESGTVTVHTPYGTCSGAAQGTQDYKRVDGVASSELTVYFSYGKGIKGPCFTIITGGTDTVILQTGE